MESFEENGNGRIFRREDVNKLQSSLFTLEGIMIANANSTNGNLQQGGHLFELFKQAEVKYYINKVTEIIRVKM